MKERDCSHCIYKVKQRFVRQGNLTIPLPPVCTQGEQLDKKSPCKHEKSIIVFYKRR
jgi:hypothetical protein